MTLFVLIKSYKGCTLSKSSLSFSWNGLLPEGELKLWAPLPRMVEFVFNSGRYGWTEDMIENFRCLVWRYCISCIEQYGAMHVLSIYTYLKTLRDSRHQIISGVFNLKELWNDMCSKVATTSTLKNPLPAEKVKGNKWNLSDILSWSLLKGADLHGLKTRRRWL